MLPFSKKPIVVTSDQLAAAVMQFIQRSRNLLRTELLQVKGAQKWSLEPAEITLLDREILVAMLWAASKAMGPDKRLLDALHDQYLQSYYRSGATHEEGAAYANSAQAELHERYTTYYEAMGSGTTGAGFEKVGFEMTHFFFPKHRPVMDISITASISAFMGIFIVNLLKLRGKYELKDA
ncbi:MAG: hypothetical protein DMG96_26320 [Acidobacteria bacterium]|nr:MAG: hypothetical protein DMG96_26320 [Acidobacteriota bacterium]